MISSFERWFRHRTTPELIRLHDALLTLHGDNDIKREFQDTGLFELIKTIKGIVKNRRANSHAQARLAEACFKETS